MTAGRYDEKQLELLLRDYDIARSDDRNTTSVLAAMIGTSVALLAGLVAIAGRSCAFLGGRGECLQLPNAVLAFLPVLPIGVLGYAAIVGTINTMRSFYIRALEHELRSYFGRDLEAAPGLLPMSATELVLAVGSGRRGRPTLRLFAGLLLVSAVVAFGGLTWAIADVLGSPWNWVMAFIYVPLVGMFAAEAAAVNIFGRSLFAAAVRSLRHTSYPGDVFVRAWFGGRSLLAYLVLPRPEDAIKWLFVPLAYVLGRCLLPDAALVDWLVFVAFFVAFEYLGYQARYQYNDVRGLGADLRHPERAARARLPIDRGDRDGPRRAIRMSLSVAALRVLTLIAVIAVGGAHARAVLLWPTVALIASTVVYEFLRELPTPRTSSRRRMVAWLIWVLVGSGYAIRVAVGLLAAGGGPPWTFWLLVLAAGSFGAAFVTVVWVLEATAFLTLAREPGREHSTEWTFERSSTGDGLGRKTHLLQLLPWIGILARPRRTAQVVLMRGDREKPLSARTSLCAPWNVALVVGVLLAVAGVASATPGPWVAALAAAPVVAASLAGATALVSGTGRRLAVVAVVAVTTGLLVAVVDPRVGVVAAVVAALLPLVQVLFGTRSYRQLKDGPREFGAALVRGLAVAYWVVVGPRTHELLAESSAQRSASRRKATARG